MNVSASSLQNIRAGIYTTLTACGPYSSADVSACDFGILDTTTGCAVLFMPGTSTFTPEAYGSAPSRDDLRAWGVGGQIWVKDTGDPLTFNARVWQAHDDFYATLHKDTSLNGTADASRITRFQYAVDGDDRQGQHWGVIAWEIVAEQL